MKELIETIGLLLSNSRTRVHFLQIGAMDGKSFDPLHRLIMDYHWHGVLVEPVPAHFKSLQELYKDVEGLQFANVAISHQPGTQAFYFIEPETVREQGLPEWVLGVSSLSKDYIKDQEAFLNQWGKENITQHLTKIEVETTTVPLLLKQYPLPKVDLLQIDAEGFDYFILSQWDFTAQKPAVVNIEFARLSEQEKKATIDLLTASSYFIALSGLDLIAFQPRLLDAAVSQWLF